jgi:hypothetical protein
MKTKYLTVFLLSLIIITKVFSQNSNLTAGTMWCNIDGDTVSFNLASTQTPDYFDVLGGNADKGLFRIIWEKVSSPSQIKPQTAELSGFTGDKNNSTLSVLWADFYTNTPYVIKKGQLTITENSGNVIRGTLQLTVELGGSSILGELLKGKKESVLTGGRFEIGY